MGITEKIATCTACHLHHHRTKPVPGRGPVPCSLMLVGEAPGEQEDIQGKPFVGPAGKMLANLLRRAEITECFVTNLLKCRPPGNRDPEFEELKACRPFLEQQIMAVQPRVIVALGRHAAVNLSMTFGPISSLMTVDLFWRPMTVTTDLRIPVVPVYHPAYYLRLMQGDKEKAREALQEAIRRLRGAARMSHYPEG